MAYSPADYYRFWMAELAGDGAHRAGQHLRANCPIHAGSNGTFSVNLQTGAAHCFKCDKSWGMIEFSIERHGYTKSEAHDYVRRVTGHPETSADHWNLPLSKPYAITDDEWRLGNLNQRIDSYAAKISTEEKAQYKPDAIYAYEPAKAVKVKLRDAVTGKKRLVWYAMTDKGGWKNPSRIMGLQIPLYRAATLAGAIEIWLLNGEKAVDRAVRDWGVVATCLPNGEGNWRPEYLEFFKPNQVVLIFTDNDAQGDKHGRVVGGALAAAGIQSRIVKLPGLPEKGDLYDYIEAGGTLERCLEIARVAPAGDAAQAPAPRLPKAETNGAPPRPPSPPTDAGQPDLIPYEWNDTGNADRLIAYLKGNAHYCSPPGIWLIWNGKFWRPDDRDHSRMARYAKAAMRLLSRQAGDNESLFKFAMKSMNRSSILSMIALARELALKDYSDFDAQHYLIPALNGVMDIRTGEFREHRKEDYLTRLFPCHYRPELGLPQHYLRVLDELMGGGPDASDGDLGIAMRRMDYLQKAFGYLLTGEMEEKAFFVLLGEGNSGKTLILGILCDVMGEYAAAIDPLTFTSSSRQGDSNKKSDLARMKGARVAHAAEPPGNEHFDQGVLKQLTQGDSIVSASYKHQDTFSYRPTAKLIIETNRMLRIDTADPAFTNRLHLISFNVRITEERMDRKLRDKLRMELDAIFTWMVEGALIWRKEGLLRPIEQQETITGVIQESIEDDGLGPFIEECFDRGERLSCAVGEVEKLHLAWSKRNGKRPLNRVWLARRMTQRDYIARVEQRGQRRGIARLQGICPKEPLFPATGGRDAQYKDDRDDD